MKTLVFLVLILNQQPTQEEPKIKGRALLLPDISVIGDIVNELRLGKKVENNFSLREFEFAFQSFLFPDIRADVFISFHGPTFGHTHAESENHAHTGPDIEEAFISFLNIGAGFSGKLGRRFIEFGKFNPLHPEQWAYVDPPKVLQETFQSFNLIGDGGQIEWLAPTPFLLRLQGGVWRKFEGKFQDVFFTGRTFTSYGIGESEISFGISYAGGKSKLFQEGMTKEIFSNIFGADISYLFARGYTKINFILEPLVELREKETMFRGLYSSLFYSQRRFQVGFRFDLFSKENHENEHSHSGNSHNENEHSHSELELGISPIFAFLLTETTKIRFQWSFFPKSNVKNIIFFQFLFGMGPHAHVLQF
ncbi:MAG: hypothetical protein ACO2PO_09365 [Candidatus Calescibacterium sp.]